MEEEEEEEITRVTFGIDDYIQSLSVQNRIMNTNHLSSACTHSQTHTRGRVRIYYVLMLKELLPVSTATEF